ncbi:hypothetical protein ACP70R_032137 [Stipagrostis hirtigluma subsp. patula]
MSKRRAGDEARKEYDMSKRPWLGRCSGHLAESDMSNKPLLARCSGRSAKRPAQQRKQHLYLVVDDWERGYSIYRVRHDDFDSDAGLEAGTASLVVRVEAQHANSRSFAAHGAKIFAMNPSESSTGIPVFDTETLGMTVCPCPDSRGDCGSTPFYASVGGKLLSFASPFLDVLGPEPLPTENTWSWTSVSPPPPFSSTLICGYAVHPDNRTIFVSVKNIVSYPGRLACTFTFDMERFEWTRLGDWLLPFKGRAYYDHDLDAWVGLCLHKEGVGRVCCCDVPPSTGCTTMPSWKLGVDVLFDKDKRHVGAKLVYIGDSRFCLVESRLPKDDDYYPRLRSVKMTSFVLKYGKKGELKVYSQRTYGSMSYQIAHEGFDLGTDPVAFWILTHSRRPPPTEGQVTRVIGFVRAELDGSVTESAWRTMELRTSNCLQLRLTLANRMGPTRDVARTTLCYRAGRYGQLTPLVIDLPIGNERINLVVLRHNTPVDNQLRYPDLDAPAV